MPRNSLPHALVPLGKGWKIIVPVAAMLIAALAIGGSLYFTRRTHALSESDIIVLCDFANSTGDPVFDDALKQAVSVQLAQSPFYNILPDQKVRTEAQLMGRSPQEPITEQVAQGICQRTGSKALLVGSIASLGTQYVIGLKAVLCQTGQPLAQEQAQAAHKEDVLKTLGEETTHLRKKLGESLSSVQKFDVPIIDATTSSLEALKEFSLGGRALGEKGDAAAIPFYKRAIELDPSFAIAYLWLASSYSNLGESGRANENIMHAYQLRDRVSEREKLSIDVYYNMSVTGDLEKENQLLGLDAQTYERADFPHLFLSINYVAMGLYEKALAETLEDIRLNPEAGGIEYGDLMDCYIALNRLSEAKRVYEQRQARKIDAPYLHQFRYQIAFLENDAAEMNQQVAWSQDKPVKDLFLSAQSDTEAFFGHLGKARVLSERAVEAARHNDQKETAAEWQMDAATRGGIWKC